MKKQKTKEIPVLIYFDFIKTLNRFLDKPKFLDVATKVVGRDSGLIISFWVGYIPKLLFENIFTVKNLRGAIDSGSIDKLVEPQKLLFYANNPKAGSDCAYLTQAFAIWQLEFSILHHKYFKEKINFNVRQIEKITNEILGPNNKVIENLTKLRSYLNPSKYDHQQAIKENSDGKGLVYSYYDVNNNEDLLKYLVFSPSDIYQVYLGMMGKILINDQQKLKSILEGWDLSVDRPSLFSITLTGFFLKMEKEILSVG